MLVVTTTAMSALNVQETEMPVSQAPSITFEENDFGVEVIVIAEDAELHGEIRLDDELVISIYGWSEFHYIVDRIYDEERFIQVMAYAQSPECEPSNVVSAFYCLAAMERPESMAPEITYEVFDSEVVITVVYEGMLYFKIDGEDVFPSETGSGWASYVIPRGEEDIVIMVEAWAQYDETYLPSSVVCVMIEVPALLPPVLEMTSPPRIDYIYVVYPDSSCVTIENTDDDPYADIYYKIQQSIDDEFCDITEWMEYDDSFTISGWGIFRVLAYAKASGKQASEIVDCDINNYPQIDVYQVYDFVVDGIYYSEKYCPEGEVWVSTESMEDFFMWIFPQAHTQCYHGDVVIPSSVEYEGKTYTVTGIGENAFEYCDVSSVILPNTIKILDRGAFCGATLNEITLPASVIYIDEYALVGPNLTKIVCMGTTPPEITDYYLSLDEMYWQATLFVPNESLEAYKTHDLWGKFLNIVPFIGAGPGDINGDGIIAIGDVTDIIDQLLSGEELPAYYDVNGDGTVTIGDITALIDMLLGTN